MAMFDYEGAQALLKSGRVLGLRNEDGRHLAWIVALARVEELPGHSLAFGVNAPGILAVTKSMGWRVQRLPDFERVIPSEITWQSVCFGGRSNLSRFKFRGRDQNFQIWIDDLNKVQYSYNFAAQRCITPDAASEVRYEVAKAVYDSKMLYGALQEYVKGYQQNE